MIKPVYSHRFKRNVFKLDTRVGGKRIVRIFLDKGDAEKVQFRLKHEGNARRYGLSVTKARPLLKDLVDKRLADIKNPREHARAGRVLAEMLILLPDAYVDETSKADIKKYVDKRALEGLKPQSIDRELNIISAMLNHADTYYPQLEQWRPPKMPRPKITDGRRERVWTADDITRILGQLFAPRSKEEQKQSAEARHRVGHKVRFCLLSGVRHGEMNLIRKVDVDWDSRTIRVRQGKTGNYKVIGPVGPTTVEILREFADGSPGAFVFSRGGNITPKFYRILRHACEKAGVPYGRKTPGGLVLHDARHTATTHLLESGVSPATAREWMGWSMSSFVMYYSHPSIQSREQAGAALEKLAGEVHR